MCKVQSPNQSGNGKRLSFDLPSCIKERIRAVPFQECGSSEDTLMWKFTKDGDFSTNSAYQNIITDVGMENTFKGAWLWKLDTFPKIRSFFWLCMHDSVPVREVLVGRGIPCNSLCPVCGMQSESINHLLRECQFALYFWSKFRAPNANLSSQSQSLGEWLYDNCHSNRVHHNSIPWSMIFPFAVWFLWKHRNKVVFDNIPLNMNLHNLCLSQALEFFFCVGKVRKVNQRCFIQVSWTKPPKGWFKLNTNGASAGNPGKAGGGGLIRDTNGHWVKGYARSIGFTTSVIAEL